MQKQNFGAYQAWLERTLIMELSSLLRDQMPRAGSDVERYILSAQQHREVVSYVGERFALLAIRTAGFRPEESGDWRSGKGKGAGWPITLHAEDFGISLDTLDVDGILADLVESDLAKQTKKEAA